MSGLDVADQHMAQARTHVDAVPAPDVVRMALGPSPGSNERLEQRKPLLPGELVESQAGRNDTLAAVSAREDRPCLSYGSALTTRVEPPSTLPPVDVAENDFEDDRALLRHTAVGVLSDALARPPGSRFAPSRIHRLLDGSGRLMRRGPCGRSSK